MAGTDNNKKIGQLFLKDLRLLVIILMDDAALVGCQSQNFLHSGG